MSLFTIIAKCQEEKPYKKREQLAEDIAQNLLRECPGVAMINAATLRHFIFKMMDYNNLHTGATGTGEYAVGCTGSTVSFPLTGGSKLVLTCPDDHIVLKVCPDCKMTANISDPLCPECNHLYPEYEQEQTVVAAAIASLKMAAELTAGNAIVLDDAVEGFKVTEADVKKHLRDVGKYMPRI